MKDINNIGMLWIEGGISWIERLCILSYLRNDYNVILYHYGPVHNIPKGVVLRDAREILSDDIIYKSMLKYGSPAIHADKFRYRLLKYRDDIIWSDVDAYCLRRFNLNDGYFLSWGDKGYILIGVLRIPSDSQALSNLINFTDDDYPIPVWESDKYKRYLKFRERIGFPVHVTKQRWTVWGPRALTYYMVESGEDEFVLPSRCLYPIPSKNKEIIFSREISLQDFISDKGIYSIHLYGTWLRYSVLERGVKEGCLLHQLAEREGVEINKDFLPRSPGGIERMLLSVRKRLKV